MKIIACVKKDIKMAFRNYYIYFSLGFALIFIALVLFVIPKENVSNAKAYIYIEPELYEQFMGGLSDNIHQGIFVESKDAIIENMESDRTAMGAYISIREGKLTFEYILQGYENERIKNIIESTLEAQFASEIGYSINTKIVELSPMTEKIPNNKYMIPIFLVMEAAFMGFFMAAAYLFIDKEEGTIKAFAVTPGKVWEYLLSKVIVFAIFGWISAFLVTIAMMGFSINYLQFSLMLLVYSMVGTVLGLILAGFFNSINGAMVWILLAMVLLSLSSISYFIPAFSPWYIKILPTYHMLYGFKDVLFGTGSTGGIYLNILSYAVLSVLLFFTAERLHHKRLSR